MPKKPSRDNPRNRATRTVQSAATLLHHMGGRGAAVAAVPDTAVAVQRLCGHLPESLRAHIVACVEKVDGIVLLADSPAWAARLKLLLADGPAAADSRPITVRVMPRESQRPPRGSRMT